MILLVQILGGDPAPGTLNASAMPVLPIDAQLQRPPRYEDVDKNEGNYGAQYGTELHDGGGMMSHKYFTDDQLRQIDTKPMPVNIMQGTNETPARGVVQRVVAPAAAVVSVPVLTTAEGVPILLNSMSPATTHYDYYYENPLWAQRGVRSCDPCIDSPEAVMQFLNTYNTRPKFGLEVRGHHTEYREKFKKNELTNEWEYVRVAHDVTDFKYVLDITPFIYPVGYICSVDEVGKTVAHMVQIYLDDANKFKSLGMEKKVNFDCAGFAHLVRREVRAQGWTELIATEYQKKQYTVRLHSSNCYQTIWNSPVLTCVLCVLPLGIPYE